MKIPLFALLPFFFLMAAVAFGQPPSTSGPASSGPAQPGPTPEQAALTTDNNAFCLDLYGQLRHEPGNLFFSPASISTAFAMAYAGAGATTATEMAAALHFTLPPDKLHPAMGALLAGLNAQHAGYELHVADALWAQQDERFLPQFLNVTRTDYGAGLHMVDFVHGPGAARETINRWVEGQTADKIKDLMPASAVTPSTRLVLVNAIYFKGDWESQFDKAATEDGDFHLSASSSVKTALMHRTGGYEFFDGGSFKALRLPYKDDELSMIVLLPNDVDGLDGLEKSLTAENLRDWTGKFQYVKKVILTLPRFTTTRTFELNDALGALGMKQAFEREKADFSGMTGARGLWIGSAVHKAFIDVNEEGTEAAAATGISMRSMVAMREPPPTEFRVDHPFVFVIRENKSGSILFVGRVTDPTK
jgi:serpin B